MASYIIRRTADAVNDAIRDGKIDPPSLARSKVYDRGVSRAFLRDLLADLTAQRTNDTNLLHQSLTPGQLVWGNTTIGPRNYMQFDPLSDPLSLAAITKPTSLSFVETAMLVQQTVSDLDERPYFGSSTVFVSYGWHGAIVAEQVESLLDQTDPEDDDYFWIDIFAVAQNQSTELEKKNNKNDVYSFESVVKHTKVTLLYWAPYNTPNPIGRVWCLYEILLTCRCKGKTLGVFFRLDDVKGILQNLTPHELARKNRIALDNIRSIDAAATFQNDWTRIHVQIEATLSPDSSYVFEKDETDNDKNLIANIRNEDFVDGLMDEDDFMFERWNLWFMFGHWSSITGRGGWAGSALGHRALDDMAKRAVEQALAMKDMPVAKGATLLHELVDPVANEPRGEDGICTSGRFLAARWPTEESMKKFHELQKEQDQNEEEDRGNEAEEEEEEGLGLTYQTNIYDLLNGQLVHAVNYSVSVFADLGYDEMAATYPGDSDDSEPEILVWNLKTGVLHGRLNLRDLILSNNKKRAKAKRKKSVTSIRMFIAKEHVIAVHHADNSVSFWDVESMVLLCSTEANYIFAPIVCLSSMNILLCGEHDSDDDETRSQNYVAAHAWNFLSKSLDRSGTFTFEEGATGLCDAGKGELCMYKEHPNGDQKEGFVDVFVSSFASGKETMNRQRRTDIDVYYIVASPVSRILAVSDFFGTTIWCTESMDTLFSVAKGDTTFDMKIIPLFLTDDVKTRKQEICMLVCSDQRGTISWWEFELPANRQKKVCGDMGGTGGTGKEKTGEHGDEKKKKKKRKKKKKKKVDEEGGTNSILHLT